MHVLQINLQRDASSGNLVLVKNGSNARPIKPLIDREVYSFVEKLQG